MESNHENESLIDKYLAGRLTEAEQRLLVEKRKSPDFAEELAFHEDLRVAATKAGKLALKDRLLRVEAEREKPNRMQVSYRRVLGIAAGVLLFLTAGALWYAQANYATEAIFAQRYSAPNFSGTRSVSANTTYQEAANAYYFEDFSRSVALLKDSLNVPGMPPRAGLLLAHAYLKQRQPADALALVPAPLPASPSREAWQWLETLALLQSGQQQDLENRLSTIAQTPNHPNQGEANELLQQLQSPWRLLTR